MTKKKKVGCFFAAILVLPISILVQYLMTIPMTGFTAIGILSSNLKEGIPASALAMQLYEVVSGELFTRRTCPTATLPIALLIGLT